MRDYNRAYARVSTRNIELLEKQLTVFFPERQLDFMLQNEI